MQTAQKKSLIVLSILVVIGAALWLPVIGTFFDTTLIDRDSERFFGIKPLKKRTTSVIIVHGIGNHCIGYADELVQNLFRDVADKSIESIEESYQRYVAGLSEPISTQALGGSYKVSSIERLRDGSCQVVEFDDSVDVGLLSEGATSVVLNEDRFCRYPSDVEDVPEADKERYCHRLNQGEDLESVVLAQDKLCKSINAASNGGVLEINCHKLYVNKQAELLSFPEENPEYVTGFVRQFSTKVTAERRFTVYEITWSPATRWIKQSLADIEKFNDRMSAHSLNRILKSDIVNAAIADAVAYLSDSGILINFDLLQAFCLTLANNTSVQRDYAFACNGQHLKQATDMFSTDNDVFLISHSLGTRVLFDTIGLLARGVVEANPPSAQGRPDLLTEIVTRFDKIGADVPSSYTESPGSEPTFAEQLNSRIPEFARAIRSIYVFTNQVPLLAANLTSPFHQTYDAGAGFREFLALWQSGEGNDRLQVVAFHDPDDMLSYNLSCWYYISVLKHQQTTKDQINNEARDRSNRNRTEVGVERRALRDRLFGSCSGTNLDTRDAQLYEQIWSTDENPLNLVDATVRLKGRRLIGLAVDPRDVHSNYFHDEVVHGLLARGN